MEPAFFVNDRRCNPWCNPAEPYVVGLSRGIELDALATMLTVRDVSDGSAGREVSRATQKSPPPSFRPSDGYRSFSAQQLGYQWQPPDTKWMLRLDADLRATDGQTLDYPWIGIVDNGHERPIAAWPGQVWESRAGPQVPFLARNVIDAQQYLQPLSPMELMPLLQTLRRPNAPLPTKFSANRRLVGTVDALEGHAIDLRDALSTPGTGVVWAAVRTDSVRPRSETDIRNLRHNTILQVTNLGLTVKDSPQSTLVFVTRLDNADPVPSARIAIIDANNRELWSGTTNADGIALAPALPLRAANNPWQLSYVVTAEKDGDLAWVASDWTGSVHPSNFGLRYQLNESRDILRGSIFTDRGVYKQGEEMQIKGVLRGDTPAGIRVLPEGTRATVTIRDARGTEVDRRTITVNRWSSLDWTWRVPESAALGTYSIAVSVPDLFAAAFANTPPPSVAGSFLVAAFRRPDFRVDATVEMETPVLGARLRGTIDARYLFGAPLGSRPARWFVMREPVLSIPSAIRERYPEQQFAFGYLPRSDALPPDVREGTTVRSWRRPVEGTESLDVEGRLRVEVPTQPDADFAATYRFEGDVEGASGQRIANRAALVIHPASIYVGLVRPPFFADVLKGLATSVVAVDLNGAPRANVPVTVTMLREQWATVRDRDYPGSSTWTRREISAGEWKVTTSSARVPLTIPLKEGGCYILRATARDELGRPVRTDVTFYARGVSAWRSEGNRIDLTPERITWSPGQTARILVQSPWERATALVTVEREGIRRHWRANISSMQDTIDVPITDDDVPNVFVSVLLLKARTSDQATNDDDPGKPAFRVGYAELTVDDASRRLRVGVSADRQEYRPGQDVTVSVTVADSAGRPRASELTLWAIDHGLLSLTNYSAPDVARAIYARKALQVQTQDNRARLIGRRNTVDRAATLNFAQGQTGSGGGGRGGFTAGLAAPAPPPPPMMRALAESIVEEGQPDEIRADFRPLVFWLGSLSTSADGRAATTVTLPDSLTTYRIMAVAGDLLSHFGAADAEIRATKPLTMLPAFPRFLARDDRATFGAVVSNGTGTGGEATVTIQSSDPALIDFGFETRRSVYIAPGESIPVRFDAATRGTGRATVRMSVALGAEKDAFEMPLPVIAAARMETVAAYGDTTSSTTEKLTMPAGMLLGAGGLTVSLASTALVGLGESARYLDEYPHSCAEPIASRALVLLLSANLDGVFGSSGSKPEEQRAAGIKALNELYAFQCPDGGFKMWPGGPCPLKSNPYLTAYILHVLHIAASLNVATDRGNIDRAIYFLTRELEQPPPEVQMLPAWSATQAYAVKVLADHQRIQPKQIDRLYQHAERMPVFALSYLADALAATNERGGARYADIVRRIGNALRVDADRAHVEEVDDASLVWLWNSNVRATAVVLSGMARRGDDNAPFAPLARWLLAARTNGRWSTTHENAIALESLVRYYRAFETDAPQMTATVALGGSPIGTASFVGRSTTAQYVHLPMAELARETTAAVTRDLVISRQGSGRLFYTARLRYQTPQSADAADRGMRIERRYEPADAEAPGPARTAFANGDLVRVRLIVTLPHEGRFLAFTDPIPAGFEAVDAMLATTATDLAARATVQSSAQDRFAWWRRGGFEHVEKHDDRVVAYATRLAAGRHELTYLIRATTAGIFNVPGTSGEAIYAPEITGRAAATVINVR
jgi:uncharacterized protein YfaS (alpha-2-macroglobulin family)